MQPEQALPGQDNPLNVPAGAPPAHVFLTSGPQAENTLVTISAEPSLSSGPAPVQHFCMTQTVEGARFTLDYTFTRGLPKGEPCRLRGTLKAIDAEFLREQDLIYFSMAPAEGDRSQPLALARLTQAMHEAFIERGAEGVYRALHEYTGRHEGGTVRVLPRVNEVMEAGLEFDASSRSTLLGGDEEDCEDEPPEPETPARVAAADDAECLLTEICNEEFAALALERDPARITDKIFCEEDYRDTFASRTRARVSAFRPVIDVTVFTGEDHPPHELQLHLRLRQVTDPKSGAAAVELESLMLSAPGPIRPFREYYRPAGGEWRALISAFSVDDSFFRALFRALHESNLSDLPSDPRQSAVFHQLEWEFGSLKPAGIMARCRSVFASLQRLIYARPH